MIVLFTDFGLEGPYTGQMKAVLHQMAPGIPTIDLFADAPAGNPKAAAYLLAAYAQWFAGGTTFLCIVDPGVGGPRPPVILEADGCWYVGPGNGLFEFVERRAAKARSFDIEWKPENLSASFHGRDLFAPVAAMLARGDAPPAARSKSSVDGYPRWRPGEGEIHNRCQWFPRQRLDRQRALQKRNFSPDTVKRREPEAPLATLIGGGVREVACA